MDDFERTFNVNVTIRVTVKENEDIYAERDAWDKVDYLMQTIESRIDDYKINYIEER